MRIESALRRGACAALLEGAREAAPDIHYDARGYASQWRQNLLRGLPFEAIEQDFGEGAGQELDGKLCAAHSSAALVVNTFGPWRIEPDSLRLAGLTGFRTLRFEATFPTGLGGTPPHLDLLAEGESVAAVESKCTEWINCKPAVFSPSYDRLHQFHGHSPWFEEMQRLRAKPDRYRFLDACQLIKHAFGLMTKFKDSSIRLVYLYWEPSNADAWLKCKQHRAEADQLADIVAASSVKLIPLSYLQLWNEWESFTPPAHLSYLKLRYSRPIESNLTRSACNRG